MFATMADAHREWHLNTGIPIGTPGCPQDACHLPEPNCYACCDTDPECPECYGPCPECGPYPHELWCSQTPQSVRDAFAAAEAEGPLGSLPMKEK